MSQHDNKARSIDLKPLQDTRLAATRGPAEDIRDWIYWLSVSDMELPDGITLSGGMLTDHACMRVITGGVWTAETAEGHRVYDPGPDGMVLYFGPQTKFMPLTVTGSFRLLTMHLRAGANTVMGGPNQLEHRDCIVDHSELVGHGNLATRFKLDASDDDWLDAMERELRRFIEATGTRKPDPVTVGFEKVCLSRPDSPISQIARDLNVSPRTLERTVRRDYGLSPKKVLRRARALDMAAALLNVVDPEEEADLELRYFDQSHLIKEIRHFFGMTPGDLSDSPHPLLRNNLEIRQARRLEAIGRWNHDEPVPWSRSKQS